MLYAEAAELGYGRTTIVDDLSLAIPRASFCALIGPNGSGKSTVLRALAGAIPARRGRILIDGRPVQEFSAKQLARRVGFLAQSPGVSEGLSVIDLVQQGRYPHRPIFAPWSAADEAACADALRLTSMDSLRDHALHTLSGGQQQRAWIAMILAQQTEILLLDEPTTYLDLAYQIEILDLLLSLVRQKQITVVAVLHDINQAARYADQILVLKKGQLFAKGAPADVINDSTISQAFGVRVSVIPNPVTGTPLCVPVARLE
jgi:iron complex transport system ATP-binding protein